MRQVVLIADNDPEFLSEIEQRLEEAGFQVLTASNPRQARMILTQRGVDLAILDLRLENERKTDVSGLEIALDRSFVNIPKIMLTGYEASIRTMREALGFTPEKLPYAIDFIEKSEGPEKLIQAARRALQMWPSLRSAVIAVSQQTKADYEIVLTQARRNYNLTVGVSVVGVMFILLGIILAFFSGLAVAVVGSVSGIIIQGLSYLFFRRLDLSNQRVDSYHQELLEAYWLEFLLAACERLPADRRMACTEQSISAATWRWFGPRRKARGSRSLPTKSEQLTQAEDRQDGKDNSVDG